MKAVLLFMALLVAGPAFAQAPPAPPCWPKPVGEHTWPVTAVINQGSQAIGMCGLWFCPAYPQGEPPYWHAYSMCWEWQKITKSATQLMVLDTAGAKALWEATAWEPLTPEDRAVVLQLGQDHYPTQPVPAQTTTICKVKPWSSPIYTSRPAFPRLADGTLNMKRIIGRVAVGKPCDCADKVGKLYAVSGQTSTTGTVFPPLLPDGTGGAYAECSEEVAQ